MPTGSVPLAVELMVDSESEAYTKCGQARVEKRYEFAKAVYFNNQAVRQRIQAENIAIDPARSSTFAAPLNC